MIKFLIGRGIGLSPGSAQYIVTQGFDIAVAAPPPAVDSSHNDVVVDDVVDDVFVDSDVIIPPIVVGLEVDLDVGAPGETRHRTALGSRHAEETVQWAASSPYAPYDVQDIFIIWNRLGQYIFSKYALPEAVTAGALYAAPTLLEVSPVPFSAGVDASNLLGGSSSGLRATGTVRIANPTGWWNSRVNDEAFLVMSAGHFHFVRGLWTDPQLTGVIGSIELLPEEIVEISYGAFAPDGPPPGPIWSL
jgi:hypothetical protein